MRVLCKAGKINVSSLVTGE